MNYKHYFQINIKRELIKMSSLKTIKTVSVKISSFRSKILTFIKMLNDIKLFNEVMMYDNEKVVKVFIRLIDAFFKLFLNEDFVKMSEEN